MSDELKPCPFCGGTNIKHDTGRDVELQRMVCQDCDAEGPCIGDAGPVLKGALVKLWNDRKPKGDAND